MGISKERLDWIDNLRGFSILAIIVLHSSQVLNGTPGYITKHIDIFNISLNPVRLALMFFVSGLFVDLGLKKGYSIYLNNKIKSILYPFVIWSLIYASLKIIFMSVSNHQQSMSNVIMMHITGGGDITWFLNSLFIFFIIIIPIRRLPIWSVFFTCITLSLLIPSIPENTIFSSFDNGHINKSIYLFIFFYLGDYLVKNNIQLNNLKLDWIVVTSAITFTILSLINFSIKVPYQYLSPLAISSIPLFVYLSQKFTFGLTTFIGRNSIVFYLTHYLIIQVSSKLIKFSDATPTIQDLRFFITLILALIIPMTICKLRIKMKLNLLFTAR
ncbi:acyltransferase family protein [Klebsiella pneumoniae]